MSLRGDMRRLLWTLVRRSDRGSSEDCRRGLLCHKRNADAAWTTAAKAGKTFGSFTARLKAVLFKLKVLRGSFGVGLFRVLCRGQGGLPCGQPEGAGDMLLGERQVYRRHQRH